MGPSGKSARRGTIGAKSGIVIILFSDLVDSTELLDRLGDDVAGKLRRKHFELLGIAVRTHRGTEVKNLGDGLMATFPSAIDAVRCAIAMQQAVHRHGQQDPDLRVAMRIGLHAGEPLREQDDYFGSAVVLAKRLCDSADGGDIIASELVRRIVEPRGSFRFEDRELPALKGGDIQSAAGAVVWRPSDDDYTEFTGDASPQPPEPHRRVPALIVTVAALVALTSIVSVLVSNRDRAPQTAAPSGASGGSGSPGGGGGPTSDFDVNYFDVDDFGWLNSLTGRAVITGTLSCTAPVPVPVRLEIELTQGDLQRREKRTLQCDGKNPWAVVVGPFSDEDIGFDASLYPQGARDARLQDSSSLTLRSCMKIGTLDDDDLGPSAQDDVICALAGGDTPSREAEATMSYADSTATMSSSAREATTSSPAASERTGSSAGPATTSSTAMRAGMCSGEARALTGAFPATNRGKKSAVRPFLEV